MLCSSVPYVVLAVIGATHLWTEQGFGPKRIQTLMGHASVAMTFDRYGYLFEARDADEQAMAAIAARLID